MRKLGGWWRLWIVILVGLLGWTTWESLASPDLIGASTRPTNCVPGTLRQWSGGGGFLVDVADVTPVIPAWNETAPTAGNELLDKYLAPERRSADPLDDALQKARERKAKEPPPAPTYSCVTIWQLLTGWLVSLLTAIGLLALVWVARWIWAGFKGNKT